MAPKTKKPAADDIEDNEDIQDINDKPAKGKRAKPPKKAKGKTAGDDLEGGAPETEDQKKDKREKREKKERKPGGLGKLVPVTVALLVVAGVSALLFFNLFGIRSRYVLPFVQNIPIIGNLVTPTPEEAAESADPFAGMTAEQLVAEINKRQAEIDGLMQDRQELNDKNKLYLDEIARLSEFEAAQLQFKADKEEFDRLIAQNDPAAYQKFYEQISPENAERLYAEAVRTVQYTKEYKKYFATVQAVDETDAAKILEELVKTDVDLVVLILNSLDSEHSGTILSNMDPVVAASLLRRMPPEQQQP